MNKQLEGGQDSLTAVAVQHELVSVAVTKLRLLQRFVSVVECHQETREGATVCGHWKFPSTFIPLRTHTHTHTHIHRCPGFILETVLHKQHAILSATCMSHRTIRNQTSETQYCHLPYNGNNYHKSVTALI